MNLWGLFCSSFRLCLSCCLQHRVNVLSGSKATQNSSKMHSCFQEVDLKTLVIFFRSGNLLNLIMVCFIKRTKTFKTLKHVELQLQCVKRKNKSFWQIEPCVLGNLHSECHTCRRTLLASLCSGTQFHWSS